jgi:type IV fimbrial biogenesis protein FimT
VSKSRRATRSTGGAPGFTLIEMLFTVSLAGIVLAIAAPPFARMNADIRTRSTAEQLAGALRLAQLSAVTRNRPAAFLLTDAAPGADATANFNGRNWLVKFLPSASPRGEHDPSDLIQVATIARQNRVTLTGPAQVCFDAQGMQANAPGATGSPSSACSMPGDGHGGPTSYVVSRSDATRRFNVRVYRTGRVAVCDAAEDRVQSATSCL